MPVPQPIPTDVRFQNLTGRTFEKLTVLFYAGRHKNKYSLWHCRCDCGRELTLVSSRLTLGQTKSCLHCFRHAPKKKTRADFEDLTGQTFGRLTVVAFERRNKETNRTYWRCSCKCGEFKITRADCLKSGTVVSCGCQNIVRDWMNHPKPSERTCPGCHNTFPLNREHFYRFPRSKYGFSRRCIGCVSKKSAARAKVLMREYRLAALAHYSGNPPFCQCPGCNETHLEFLTIDHIGGGGRQHRISIHNRNLYDWLQANNYPSGFRVLCMNCNFSHGKYGYCPHSVSLNSQTLP